jgi:putative transposase
MKERNSSVGLSKICWLFGITRQAYYQQLYLQKDIALEQSLVLKEVMKIREQHPRMGTRKLHLMLGGFMVSHHIKMGRDALFDLLSCHGLLVRRRRRSVKTTQSQHWLKKYTNLVKDYVPSRPNELYVSDITYWKITSGFVYLSLVTDAYSHKIVGYHLAETLNAVHSVKALQMALSGLKIEPESHLSLHSRTHHSDRGVQYCSEKYIKLLKDYNFQISMTETGDPLDNAIAERVNGILKEEYLNCYQIKNITEARKLLDKVIILYNKKRPHMTLGNLTPEKIHTNQLKITEKKWKKYYQKKENVNQF